MNKHEATVPAGLKPGDTFHQDHCEMIVMTVKVDGIEQPELCAVEMIRALPTAQVVPSPINRKYFNPNNLVELVDSMRETGQTTAGIVRLKADGTYELVAGDRRWQACCTLGIPFKAVVRDYTDAQAAEILLTENAKRENLRPVDEAQIYGAMLALRDEHGNHVFTLRKIAQRVHGDETRFAYVARMHKLLDLPQEVAEALNKGVIPVAVAFLVARIADPKDREEAGKKVIKDKWSGLPLTVKQAADMIQREYQVSIKGWGNDLVESTDLLDAAQLEAFGFKGKPGEKDDGSCARCSWLAKNHPAFADSVSGGRGDVGVDPMTCTRAKCHQVKLNTLWVQKAEQFRLEKASQAMILPTGEFKPGHASKYVALDASPSGHDTGDWSQEAPKWKKLLKGADVPVVIGDNPENGEPVLLVERSVALTAAKGAHPDLFVKAPVEVKLKDLSADERKAHEERERKRKEREATDKKIAEEVKADSLRAMLDQITKDGLGIDGRKILVQAVARNAGEMEPILSLLLGKKVKAETWKQEEKLLAEAVEGRTANELDAMVALMAVHDDVMMSGTQKAEDFNNLCGAVGVDLKAVAKRVRDAYAMAYRAAKKATKAKAEPVKSSEQINAELKTQAVIAEGDEQREKMPSRGMDGPIMEAAKRGMPTVTGKRSKLGMWPVDDEPSAAESDAADVAVPEKKDPQPSDKPKIHKNQRAGESDEDFRKREAARVAAYKAKRKAAKKAA